MVKRAVWARSLGAQFGRAGGSMVTAERMEAALHRLAYRCAFYAAAERASDPIRYFDRILPVDWKDKFDMAAAKWAVQADTQLREEFFASFSALLSSNLCRLGVTGEA